MPRTFRRLVSMLLLAAPLLAAPAAATTLHGEFTLADGTVLTGWFREDREDACGHHLFEARRDGNPWAEWIDDDALAAQRRADFFATHGLIDRLAYVLDGGDREKRNLAFICRYDALASLERDGDGIAATLRDGSQHRLRERGRDLSSDLVIHADEIHELEWDDLRAARFTPATTAPPPELTPVWGTFTGSEGTQTGWIQWDRSECLAGDVLDGDEEGRDHEVPLGDITSIEKVDARSCRVTLRDGTELVLSGSNDVNEDNRGIVVLVAGLGRVVHPWHRFDRLELTDPPVTPPVDEPAYGELRGTVTTTGGARHTGRLAFDLDEGWDWDIFDGELRGVEYEIPFGNIDRIERAGDDSATVQLRDGRRLEMDDGPDAGTGNHGLLVVTERGPVMLVWAEVAAIEFSR
ncbi:MAG: hypothetical protein GY838_01975 [bacterium]|nr:hypothetical protein [bacterium]